MYSSAPREGRVTNLNFKSACLIAGSRKDVQPALCNWLHHVLVPYPVVRIVRSAGPRQLIEDAYGLAVPFLLQLPYERQPSGAPWLLHMTNITRYNCKPLIKPKRGCKACCVHRICSTPTPEFFSLPGQLAAQTLGTSCRKITALQVRSVNRLTMWSIGFQVPFRN